MNAMANSFPVETAEENLDLVSITGCRRISTVIYGYTGEYMNVDPKVLAAALARDVRIDN
jgi:hypothetical protein